MENINVDIMKMVWDDWCDIVTSNDLLEMPKQPRVNVYLSEEDYDFFKEWATTERRSMGNLAAYIVAEAIASKRKEKTGQ